MKDLYETTQSPVLQSPYDQISKNCNQVPVSLERYRMTFARSKDTPNYATKHFLLPIIRMALEHSFTITTSLHTQAGFLYYRYEKMRYG